MKLHTDIDRMANIEFDISELKEDVTAIQADIAYVRRIAKYIGGALAAILPASLLELSRML